MFRTISLAFLTLIAALTLSFSPALAARLFPETGFSISNPKFLDFFDHRGGVRVFGYPISREFQFQGSSVQFFQRAVLQLQPDGGVGLLNILDEGLLPYTHINGSSFPAPDPSVFQTAPSPSDPNYASKAIDFVKAYAPDSWQGLNTNFYSTFINTVSLHDAFPDGNAIPALLPLINLEIWGLPTSKPAFDPNNHNFVYLRFQRGIMHFDKSTGITQGILIGDYLKSVITGQNIPPDLEQQASSSKLYRQYNNSVVSGLARPADLPATSIFAAFEKDGVVVPTPTPMATPMAPPAAPIPAAAAPTPVPTPTAIAITGSPWFVEQTRSALDKLSTKANDHYVNVRKYVFRIEETNEPSSSIDIPSRTLRVREADAFPKEWAFNRDNQIEWYAGLIVHNAVHIEQAVLGQPYTGYEAEREALTRQKNALGLVETTSPPFQLRDFVDDVLKGKEATLGEWEAPRGPEPTLSPTPTE